MKIDYSLMNESHINGVYELSKECFAIPWTLDSISNELNNPLAKYVIAQDLSTGEVIGFVGVWIIDDVLGKAVFSLAFSIMNCKKFDFKEEGLRKGYYSDNGEDAIIMWKRG